jgi:DNA mismatch endonuclease (patch repair protein)
VDTAPERLLRGELWKRGLRYRLHSKRLPGRPDVVFPAARVAVFVDGDFWHGNQWKRRGFKSLEHQFRESPSAPYWIGKIKGNVRRDRETNQHLMEMGWRVVRLWESEIQSDLDACVRRVYDAVEESRKASNGA